MADYTKDWTNGWFTSDADRKKLDPIRQRGLIHEPMFPEMTQVTARTMAMDLVPVQPMDLPKGLINYIDFKYDKDD